MNMKKIKIIFIIAAAAAVIAAALIIILPLRSHASRALEELKDRVQETGAAYTYSASTITDDGREISWEGTAEGRDAERCMDLILSLKTVRRHEPYDPAATAGDDTVSFTLIATLPGGERFILESAGGLYRFTLSDDGELLIRACKVGREQIVDFFTVLTKGLVEQSR